jgi:hypothetical protein
MGFDVPDDLVHQPLERAEVLWLMRGEPLEFVAEGLALPQQN